MATNMVTLIMVVVRISTLVMVIIANLLIETNHMIDYDNITFILNLN